MLSSLLLAIALIAYGAASGAFVARLLTRHERFAVVGERVLVAGLAMQAAGRTLHAVQDGVWPVTTGMEALGLLALFVGVLHVWATSRYKAVVLGAFSAPLMFVAHAASLAFSPERGVVPDALRSAWFPVHVSLAITADASFTVAGVAALAWLLQEKLLREKRLHSAWRALPPLHLLDEMQHRYVMLGLFLLTLGMATGSLYARQTWGAYWSWDPKQCWTLLTWIVFAAILHARVTIGWRGRRAAWVTVTAFALVVVAIGGLNLLVRTRHGGEFDGTKNVPMTMREQR